MFRSLFLWIGRFNNTDQAAVNAAIQVSILVLVDRAIQPATCAIDRLYRSSGFDPCSCGSGDSTLVAGFLIGLLLLFRSLFLWIGRFNFVACPRERVGGAGFDPCSCGSGDSTLVAAAGGAPHLVFRSLFLWIGRFNPKMAGERWPPPFGFRSLFLWIGRFNLVYGFASFPLGRFRSLFLWIGRFNRSPCLDSYATTYRFDPCSCGSGDSTRKS